jgi:uncharacterized membrane protein YgdD (TMEM256/DUF423 family)
VKALQLAGVFGALAVALGAFGAHGLKAYLSAADLALWHTAVQYQFWHSLALLAVAIAPGRVPRRACLWAWSLGMLLFCGSLYALALGAPRGLGMLTPLGGLALIIGWAVLVWPERSGQ